MSDSPYHMTLSLNLLNHLGINLYSNVPSVLSETVANAWDADAQLVEIIIDKIKGTITITDDGHGMDLADINGKYLTVGYRRRDVGNQGATSPSLNRPVMGRKGIGKLSLFSISRDISIYTIKDGIKSAFRLLLADIEEKITRQESIYRPSVLTDFPKDHSAGTRIILSNLKKNQNQTESALRKRLARRFSILV
jgi:HSP90 family molecular chaperone